MSLSFVTSIVTCDGREMHLLGKLAWHSSDELV